ncbi:hypothetical protein GE09DRAFT_1073233 [Coniochaeta sp. 2T2.1]|nr:hypothetical protein GE09DRAFT_1073233 [Coniochaeta sp. 2T2.1]
MDPPDGSGTPPALATEQAPSDEVVADEATENSAHDPPVSTVAALSITDHHSTATELPDSDLTSRTLQLLEASNSNISSTTPGHSSSHGINSTEVPKTNCTTQSDLSMVAPVRVFKEIPEAAPEVKDETMSPPAKTPRICGVCDKEPGKYKCPRCGMSYCSVPCSKIHKANHPADLPPKPPTAPPPAQKAGTKRPCGPEDPFAVFLDHESDLKRLFAKYPNLEADLCQITAATEPPPDLPKPNGLPTKYRPPGGQGRQEEPWTRQVGLKKGVTKLKKMRMDPGEEGDGVREFCEWVVHVLSTDRERREVEALDVVRRKTEVEEKGVIRGLLKMDED